MSTSIFIEQLAAGHAADAKETLSNLLSARAFESLDARKQELAATLFGGQVEEEVEELDEVSLKTATSAYVKRMGKDDDKSPVKAVKTMDHIAKKHGVVGVARAAKAADKEYGLNDPVHNKRKDFVKGVMAGVKEEVEQVEEGTMTGITLGQKVKNKQGGYNQDVHHKGEKIGHIEAYKHRTGMRYGSHHDASGDGSAGNRSPEESIDDIRWSHAQHLKDTKVKK